MATWLLAARNCERVTAFTKLLSSFHAKRKVTKWSLNEEFVNISAEVRDALSSFKPVVALETTIVTHGMPYPCNIETALRVEETVRSNGGVPATIGIIDGKICIGLSKSQLQRLAEPNPSTVKVSRRDMSIAISQCLNGGTTVSGTMVCANAVGIPIFVTGGIGGVHKEGQNTFDISADLTELGRTNTAVISSGIKSILDIERTLEYLETQGITVATYGPSKEFPAFFTSHSGINVEYNLTTPRQCAELINASNKLSLSNGILIGVPIPEEHSINNIDDIIQQAVSEASDNNITGKDVTPYILKRVNQLSTGQSLTSNIALIINNAKIGTLIAVELSKIRQESNTQSTPSSSVRNHPIQFNKPVTNRPVVIGASILDFIAKTENKQIEDGTNAGTLRTSFGGVARNIAESLARLDCDPFLISAVGNDQHGNQIINHLKDIRMCLDGINILPMQSSSTYCAVLDGTGEVYCAIGDMSANDTVTIDWIKGFNDIIQSAPIVCIDGNISVDAIKYVCQLCHEAGVSVWFEPTCIRKSTKPLQAGVQHMLDYASPNIQELFAMTGANTNISKPVELDVILARVCSLLNDIPTLFVTLGNKGVLYASKDKETASLYPVIPTPMEVISVSGAGDCLVGGVLAGLINNPSMVDTALLMGLLCAHKSVQSLQTVPDTIRLDNIQTDISTGISIEQTHLKL